MHMLNDYVRGKATVLVTSFAVFALIQQSPVRIFVLVTIANSNLSVWGKTTTLAFLVLQVMLTMLETEEGPSCTCTTVARQSACFAGLASKPVQPEHVSLTEFRDLGEAIGSCAGGERAEIISTRALVIRVSRA